MEFSLHRQLKERYAPDAASTEVTLGSYRIDAVRRNGQLVEIQFASLSAISRKVERLLADGHRVLVVKPLVERRYLIRQDEPEGPVVSRRWSPHRGTGLDVFEELVFFRKLFPHPNLTIEAPLVQVEEWRLPPKSRRRKFSRPYRINDVLLSKIVATHRLRTANDLWKMVPNTVLPDEFSTADLVRAWSCRRWIAQRAAYSLRHAGAITATRRNRGGWVYEITRPSRRALRRAA